MAIKLKPLKEQTIVITGASSGIGLITAQQAAKRGANVVLFARNEEVLTKVAAEIEAEGGSALAVAGDVADRAAVEKLADAAIARFGSIDTWVNDAGLGLFGQVEETDVGDGERV